ncbi:MAG: trypsin-like peptidase domain-containing protein [Myxococcaceae bacterium]
MRTPAFLMAVAMTLACRSAAPPATTPSGPVARPAISAPIAREARALPSFGELVKLARGAVVNVEVLSLAKQPSRARNSWEEFFGYAPRSQPDALKQGAGSGFVIDPKGLVATNNHVVEGAVSIRLTFDDGRTFDAHALGTDPLTDLALLKVQNPPPDLPWVKLGDSDTLNVGDWVVAIGNPFGLASSVSAGILSARARAIGAGPYDDFLQTDAAINPGNSGGPLFNLEGEVVGINTAIIGGGTGIGFAVPSNLAKLLLPQLEAKGRVVRGWLGVNVEDVSAEVAKALGLSQRRAALLVGVPEDGPAGKAGLAALDVVTHLDGKPVTSGGGLSRAIALHPPGSKVTLGVSRGGDTKEVLVTLGERPDIEGIAERQTPQKTPEDPRERLGLAFSDVDPRFSDARSGALIIQVAPGGAAARGGLSPGMVVAEVAGRPVRRAEDFRRALLAAKPDDLLLLRVIVRGGQTLRALRMPRE